MTESFSFDDLVDEVSKLYSLHKLSPPLVRLLAGYAHKIEAVLIAGSEYKAEFNNFRGLCELPTGSLLLCDCYNNQIRYLDIKTQALTTYAGSSEGFADGAAHEAKFNYPRGLTCDPEGAL